MFKYFNNYCNKSLVNKLTQHILINTTEYLLIVRVLLPVSLLNSKPNHYFIQLSIIFPLHSSEKTPTLSLSLSIVFFITFPSFFLQPLTLKSWPPR